MNFKELIEGGFFPTDENGFALIATHGDEDLGIPAGKARVITTEAPGDYPLVGLDIQGFATQWDVHGFVRQEINNVDRFADDEIMPNSLVEPASVSKVEFLMVGADDTVLGVFDSEDDARLIADPEFGDSVARVTTTVYVNEEGLAIESTRETLVDEIEDDFEDWSADDAEDGVESDDNYSGDEDDCGDPECPVCHPETYEAEDFRHD